MSRLVKLNEGALLAAGLPRDFVETMRHLVRQAGAITFDTTLPEVASMTDGLTPIVNGLTITLTATNQTVSTLEVDATEPAYVDTSIARRLDEMQAELERANGERAAMAREISQLRDDLGMYESGQMETGASIRYKLGISTLSGSNTGDQTTITGNAGSATVLQTARTINGVSFNGSANITVADGTRALLAGASTQDFACKILTASADAVINSAKIGKSGTANFYVDADNTAVRAFSAAAGAGIYFQNSAGSATWALVTVLGVTVTAGFGCNGKTAQTAFALGAAATDLATVITLANNLRTLAINNGTGS